MLESNPQRQWFVYDKEREQGPFFEEELHHKIKAREFSGEAYVYTEGMSDWALIKDTPVLSDENPIENQKNQNLPRMEIKSKDIVLTSQMIESFEAPTISDPVENLQSTKAEKQPLPKKDSWLLLKTAIVFLVLSALGFMIYDKRSLLTQKWYSMIHNQSAVVSSNTTNTTPEKSTNSDWERLKNFHLESTAKGPSFILDSSEYFGEFPIIKGALSPLLQFDNVKVAFFPDSTKSLLTVPFVRYMKVPVWDGFFTFGPVHDKSRALPPGRYNILIANENTFLGEASFELGRWPTQPKLVEIEKKLFNDRQVLAKKELDILKKKSIELNEAEKQLSSMSSQLEKSANNKVPLIIEQKWQIWTSTLDLALKEQEKSTLAEAMSHLAVSERDILEKKYLLGYSYEEIAKENNRSAGSVRIEAFRALRKLRTTLKKKV
jgi:RNA polymerase sigma factor (sigma-70 family)